VESLNLLSQHFSEDILALFKHVLTSTYFSVGVQFYEQTDVVAMGSPLYPVIGDFFMEDFEKRAQANYKPLCWFHYVDDICVIWPHGSENLERFLSHMNGLHRNKQFTMEIKRDSHLPFLDIDI
jgi:hypothetical protein